MSAFGCLPQHNHFFFGQLNGHDGVGHKRFGRNIRLWWLVHGVGKRPYLACARELYFVKSFTMTSRVFAEDSLLREVVGAAGFALGANEVWLLGIQCEPALKNRN